VIGLDISSLMIDEARRLSVDEPNCSYVLNESESLTMFEDDRFDLIYSNIVLQHLPNTRIVRGYLLEFVRILRPGGLIVFQIPSPFPPRHRLQLRPRAYGLLRRLRVAPRLAYRLGLHPIRMQGLHRDEVWNIMASAGARIVRVDSDPLDKWSVVDQVFFVTK
jgi:ubiquinone/menaquinone biosynthesis C-methylase UbiE